MRERRAEHRDRRGIDEPRPIAVAGGADGLQQRAGAVEIDVIALVEIELGFARHDAGEMEDHIGRPATAFAALPGVERSAATISILPAKRVGLRRRNDVERVSLSIGLPLSPPSLTSRSVSLRADHAGRTGDEDVHVVSLFVSQGSAIWRQRYCASRSAISPLAVPGSRESIQPPGGTAFNSLRLTRCLPAASKFSGASQRSNAALRAGHSLSSIEK